MADLQQALEGLAQWQAVVQRVTSQGVIDKLQEVVGALASYDQIMKERKAALDAINAEVAALDNEKADQARSLVIAIQRSAQAKQASDDILKTVKELVDKAKAEHATYLQSLSDEAEMMKRSYADKRVTLEKDYEQYKAMDAALRAENKKNYDAEKALLLADLQATMAERDALQSETDQFKGRLQQILKG